MFPRSLGVIGLGAIGGSIAWQAARAGVPRILGYSRERKDAVAAARHGAVTEVATDPGRVAGEVELLVLAPPPRATLDLLRALADALRRRSTLCTDVASVKGPIVRAAEELDLAGQFAGSHPFAGTHEQGFEAALPERFVGAVVYVIPLAGATRAANEIADFWTRVIGAHPVIVSAEQHDTQLAWTSHLPQALSSLLAVALARHGPSGGPYGTGTLDTTRLAAGSVEMWTDVLLMNRHALLRCLGDLGPALDDLRRALASDDAGAVGRWLAEGSRWRRMQDR
jgi:prephenate dehydrogenase